MSEGGESGGFAAVSPGVEGGGDSSGQEYGGGQQAPGASPEIASQLAETRQAAAALYQHSQQQAQHLAQMQAQMGPLMELQQRLQGNQDRQPPPIENYDEHLINLMRSQNALMEQYKNDTMYREQMQQRISQQQQQEYQEQLGAWLSNAVDVTDNTCTEAGYPGFRESLPTIAAYVENEVRGKIQNGMNPQSPEFQHYWKNKADSPQYWADVFVNKVLPMYKNRIVGRYDRMADRRQIMRVPIEEAEYPGRRNIM